MWYKSVDDPVTTGYAHHRYVASFAEWGDSLELVNCGGWLLRRAVPSTPFHDAMGCYPYFVCRDWNRLHDDLEMVGDRVVSIALVTDPFGNYTRKLLHECFEEKVIPFKEHFVVDLHSSMQLPISTHHRRNIRRGLAEVEVEAVATPMDCIEEWQLLYGNLIDRHRIRGMVRFSRQSFQRQFVVPGLAAFRACRGGETVGIVLWYRHGDVATYHLGAYSAAGYASRASYALFSASFEHLRNAGVRWLNLGSAAGMGGGSDDGLSRFKQGWSTGTKTAYFCGRVCNRDRFIDACTSRPGGGSYFPPYRWNEFGGTGGEEENGCR